MAKIIITVEVDDSGERVILKDRDGNEIKGQEHTERQPHHKYLGTVTYYKTNPECVCYWYYGTCYQVCS